MKRPSKRFFLQTRKATDATWVMEKKWKITQESKSNSLEVGLFFFSYKPSATKLTLLRGRKLTMVTNYLQSEMILQVPKKQIQFFQFLTPELTVFAWYVCWRVDRQTVDGKNPA